MGGFSWVGCVCVRGGYGWGGWGVLEGWECIGRRGGKRNTPLYHICYIKFIRS